MPFYLIFVLLFSIRCFAVDFGHCDQFVADTLRMAGRTGDIVNQFPFDVDKGKVVIRNPSAILVKEESSERDFYKYKVNLGEGIFEIRTITITKDKSGKIKAVRRDDIPSQKKLAEKKGISLSSNALYNGGLEMLFQEKGEGCRVTQGTILKQVRGNDVLGEVFIDAKYCDALTKLLSGESEQDVKKCVKILNLANEVFKNRSEELIKENKVFSQFENSFYGAAAKIAMCSPETYDLRAKYYEALSIKGGGTTRFIKSSGSGIKTE